MTQGIWIGRFRPKSKKQVKEAIEKDPSSVRIEATSWSGNEFDGLASELDFGKRIYFVGPDPHRDRRFYGMIDVTEEGLKVS